MTADPLGSPAIDAGSALSPVPTTDFDGRPRRCRRVDHGAFEFVARPADDADSDGVPDECEGARRLPGDCNQDGAFDVSDPICVLGHLFLGNPARLPCGETVAEPGNLLLLDYNGDSEVNLADGVAPLLRLFSGGGPHVLGEACAVVSGCQEGPVACE